MDGLAAMCENVARWNSRLKKVEIAAGYLRGLDDADLARAVRFLCCGPLFEGGDAKLSVGYATFRQALIAATGWDEATVAVCYREVGDSGETVALLMHGRSAMQPLTLGDAEVVYARLAKARRTADKVEILRDAFTRYRPGTLKYFVKVITGNLRIGLLAKTVEDAVVAATGAPQEAVRLANNRLGDLARVAVAARRGELDRIEARLFHPMEFMLAKPLENPGELADPGDYWVEDKYDGIRAQLHVDGGRVVIFSRGLEEVTRAFPELVRACAGISGPAVIDGEIVAWREGRALAFGVLQQRLARKAVGAALLEQAPVVFIGYDLLFAGGRMVIDETLEQRRERLEQVLTGAPDEIMLAPRMTASTAGELEAHFEAARLRGNEGLVIKRRGSFYEPGRRSGTWHKIKRPYGTLDVVVTAAEQGHGRRATVLSDYTFAVRSGDEFVNIGKAYSGLDDDEVRELTRVFRSLQAERFGRVVLVRPEVVLEVAFDGVQKSPRHKAGYALRFPRIVRWRRDKAAAECATIDEVKALYEASLAR